MLEGDPEDADDWTLGHPLLFPNILAVGSADKVWKTYEFQIRVPQDDTHTMHWWFTAFAPAEGVDVDPEVTRYGDPVPPMFWFRDPTGHTLLVVES